MNKYILVEDECAIDSKEAFKKELLELTGYTVKDFEEMGHKMHSEKDDFWCYILDGYALELFSDAQYYHLRHAYVAD